jgi:uncharacterized membrane protein
MDTLLAFADRQPLVALHLASALLALALGLVLLSRRAGDRTHRLLGRTWVALMASAVVSSAFIRDFHLPNLWGYTPIHLFTAYVAVMLPIGIVHIRRGRIEAHRKTMRGLYVGGCVIAGLFTLLPGRFLGDLLWRHALGIVS